MADPARVGSIAAAVPVATAATRHSAIVRGTHWITTLCFFALLLSGVEIVISHPRFYWGEDGNVLTPPLFSLPIPASRSSVPTGYDFVLPDQNGWSRSLHFQSAWILVFAGLLYTLSGLFNQHFRRQLLPESSDLKGAFLSEVIAKHLRLRRPGPEHGSVRRFRISVTVRESIITKPNHSSAASFRPYWALGPAALHLFLNVTDWP